MKKSANAEKHKKITFEKGIELDPNGGKDGHGKWYISHTVWTGNGKSKRKSDTFDNYEAAKKRREEVEAQIKERRKKMKEGNIQIKLVDYMQDFIETTDRNKSTLYGWKRILEQIKASNLSKLSLNELQAADIRQYIKAAQKRGLKNQTINRQLNLLSRVMERAWIDEIVPQNVVKRVEKLKEIKYEGNVYTLEDCRRIFAAAETYGNDNIKIALHLGILHGLRRGEMVGLEWSNIDLDKGVMTISQSKNKVGGKVVITTPKTKNSYRKLAINPYTLELLKELKQKQKERFGGCRFLMVNPQTGEGISPASLQKPYKIFQNKTGIPNYRLHDLRHTFATRAIYSGANIVDISHALGHSNTNTTENIYLHFVLGDNKGVVTGVGEAIFGKAE